MVGSPSSHGARGLARTRPTILLVDDDRALGGIIAKALASYGYTVVIAESGAAALVRAAETSPDLIVLDLMLPDADGLVLAGPLKSSTGAPIIICSARSGQVDRALGLKLGAADFIAKPFNLDELEMRIARLLRPEHGVQW